MRSPLFTIVLRRLFSDDCLGRAHVFPLWIVTFAVVNWFDHVTACVHLLTDAPRVLPVPERLYLPRGLMGRIECPVQSNPPLTVIVWSKSGRPLDFQSARHAKVNKQGTLIFLPVISADDGQYTCTPYSPLGAGQPSTPIRVFVRGQFLGIWELVNVIRTLYIYIYDRNT